MRQVFACGWGRRAPFLLAAIAAASLTGCGFLNRPVSIATIIAHAGELHGSEVRVQAKVGAGGDLLGHGVYQLDDGSGHIWVLTHNGVPTEGETVLIDARVNRLLKLPSALYRLAGLPEAQLVGLDEIRRR